MTHNVFAAIQVNLQRNADSTLLSIPGGRSLTGSDLESESATLASALIDLGLEPGDRVSVQIDKGWMNVVLYLAVLRCGAVYLPLNSAYTNRMQSQSFHVCGAHVTLDHVGIYTHVQPALFPKRVIYIVKYSIAYPCRIISAFSKPSIECMNFSCANRPNDVDIPFGYTT